MNLWAEIFSPAGDALGLCELIDANIERRLDGIGSIIVQVSSSKADAKLLRIGRRIHIYYSDDQFSKRSIVRGVLLRPQITPSTGPTITQWLVEDELHELKRVNTWHGHIYEDMRIADIAMDLIKRCPGWSLTVDPSIRDEITTLPANGISVFRAFYDLAQITGIHFRLRRLSEKHLEVGVFGEDAQLFLSNATEQNAESLSNHWMAFAADISLITDGTEIVNVIQPLAGSGSFPVSLRRSTLQSKYPIHKLTIDGRSVFVLRHEQSIAAYGEYQQVLIYDGDIPMSFDTTSTEPAAKILHQWAITQLKRIAVPQRTYTATAKKVHRTVLPGQKVFVQYRHNTYHFESVINHLDVNESLYVLRVSELYSVEGISQSWELSNVDAYYDTPERKLARAIQKGNRLHQITIEQQAKTLSANQQMLTNTTPISINYLMTQDVKDWGRLELTIRRQVNGPQKMRVRVTALGYEYGWLTNTFFDGEDEGYEKQIDLLDLIPFRFANWTITLTCDENVGIVDMELAIVEAFVSY